MSIGTSSAHVIIVQGVDPCAHLTGQVDFGDLVYMLVAGRLPTRPESRLFNAVLVALAEHGLTPHGLRGAIHLLWGAPRSFAARFTYTGAPEALQATGTADRDDLQDFTCGAADDAPRLLSTVGVWTRNSVIKRLAAEGGGLLGSGVEAPDVVLSDAQVIFRVCEVHGPECPPGPKFR